MMAQAIGQFTVTDQAESELFTFDFANDLQPGETISTSTWACTVAAGIDVGAAGRLTGSATNFSTRTTKRGAGFLPGVMYVLSAVITTSLGNTLELWAYLQGEVVGC